MALYRYKMKLANIRYSSRINRSDFSHLPVTEKFQCTSCESVFPSRDALAMHRMEAAAVGKKCSPVSVSNQRSSLMHDACVNLPVVQHHDLNEPDLVKHKHEGGMQIHRDVGNDTARSIVAGEKQQVINSAALQYAASVMSQWYMLWQRNPQAFSHANASANGAEHPNASANQALKVEADSQVAVAVDDCRESLPSRLPHSLVPDGCSDGGSPSELQKNTNAQTESSERKVYIEIPHRNAIALYFPESNNLHCPLCESTFSQTANLNTFIEHKCVTSSKDVAQSKRTVYRHLARPRPLRAYPKRPKSASAVDNCDCQQQPVLASDSKIEFAHECRFCSIGFQNDVLYSLHSGCHNINNPLQCNRCGIVFQSMNSFAAHTLIHG